ncbi:MAG: ABC transporter ATP-binding protein [Fischerella sp. CENA71]|nr:ABC transporter ATP-binding protein [Fischerella sp. CENA71]
MSDTVIRVENLSKKYVLSHQQEGQGKYKSLREVISNGAKSLGKKLLKPSEKEIYNPSREEFWALKDVSFEIKQGDRVGIIGRNGAGKSTLLKILSRITEPTKGRIKINGRVASLLEVGTGFHPELTGRENIFLNGAILGMSKIEIKRKFDEIVDFAEVEKFLDTPVKRYSSGMYVRLAFAVAAHLDPEILIVDEVLAVGDAQFQKKCLGKMQDVSKDQGRTVLFVSHNMDAIQRLCSQCVMLERGRVAAQGDTDSIVTRYMSSNSTMESSPNQWIDLSDVSRTGNGKARFVEVKYSSLNQEVAFQPYSYGPLEFLLAIESNISQSVGSLAINISNQTGTLLINADTASMGQLTFLRSGRNIVRFKINDLYLKEGIYIVGLWLEKTGVGHEILDYLEFAFEIEIVHLEDETFGVKIPGFVPCQFHLLEVT